MLRLILTDKGGRRENLDIVAPMYKRGCLFGVMMIDGYQCREEDVFLFGELVKGADFSNYSSVDDFFKDGTFSEGFKGAICMAYREGECVIISNAGDCRAYSSLGNILTSDDTVAWEELKLKVSECNSLSILVSYHPYRSILTNYIITPIKELSFKKTVLSIDQVDNILLCTDGFWNQLNDGDIHKIMSEDTVQRLTDFHLKNKGMGDNSTVCLVDFSAVKSP